EPHRGAPPSPSPSPSPTAAPTPSGTGTTGPSLAAVDVRFEPVAELDSPLAMATREGDERLFVAGQNGVVWALVGGPGQAAPREILDIGDDITSGGEQGLLGLAFSPDGRFMYLNFTDPDGHTNVVEYRFRAGRPDPGSRRCVLFVQQPYSNHNGGNLVFGPDGYLYIGLGDGGSGGDPENRAQSLRALLGKMLRIDPRPDGDRPYGIPPDNPFVGRSGARPEIWAYGLRNPWRYSFDRETGDLWMGDVGQGAREEIDLEPAGSAGGRNYGWNLFEGSERFQPINPLPVPNDAVRPILDYPRTGGACAVTGGYVYRGAAIPALRGAYFFGDYCDGRVRAVAPRDGRITGRRVVGAVDGLSSFGEDQDGELYALSLSGTVYRIVPA
ncbi:MAG: sorbosone dehydrogenase family protein, partial [Actinomycetota bacterium]